MGVAEANRLWEAGLSVLRRLADHGFQAYIVGGCVRDRALGRPFHDVDIATSARPEEVMGIFERAIPTGLKHGTVTVVHDGAAMEVTTFRTEFGYSDGRRPDAIVFVGTIEEDLARRDFTVNAMAAGLDGKLVDPFGGMEDLRRRVIRCVGDADARFSEDALRMVRAIRFASVLGFRLAKSVWRGIRRQAPRLKNVAMERIGAEWDKMMAGPHPERGLGLLARSGLLAHLKEPLPAAAFVCGGQESGAFRKFLPLHQMEDKDVRWAAFLAGTKASPGEAGLVFRALRFSGARQERIESAVAFARRMDPAQDREAFIDAVLDLGLPAAEDWLAAVAEPEPYRAWLRQMGVYAIGDLAVRGDELARSLNRRPGPWVGRLLRRLLKEAAAGRTANTRETLLSLAAEIVEETE